MQDKVQDKVQDEAAAGQMVCDLCGQETHDDESDVVDVFEMSGVTRERRCFDCAPPDEDDY